MLPNCKFAFQNPDSAWRALSNNRLNVAETTARAHVVRELELQQKLFVI